MSDMYKSMCIQQGYVPPACTMNGQLAWLLVNEGKDPCNGCNESRDICNGRIHLSTDENVL